MIDFSEVEELCADLVKETDSFDVKTFKVIRDRLNFNLDKSPVGPESTGKLEALGGYPSEVIQLLKAVGSVTLNASCYFDPNGQLDEMSDTEYYREIASNVGLQPENLRLIGGDHGEGRWGLLVDSSSIIFIEVDDDYFGETPKCCFENLLSWLRINFILGLLEDHLEQKGIDTCEDLSSGFSRELLQALSSIDISLTSDTWPYQTQYPLD